MPSFKPNSFFLFLTLNLLHKLAVPSTSKYSSAYSVILLLLQLALSIFSGLTEVSWSTTSTSDFFRFFSERDSDAETKPLSGRDSGTGGFHCNWLNQRATLAVEVSCKKMSCVSFDGILADFVNAFLWI